MNLEQKRWWWLLRDAINERTDMFDQPGGMINPKVNSALEFLAEHLSQNDKVVLTEANRVQNFQVRIESPLDMDSKSAGWVRNRLSSEDWAQDYRLTVTVAEVEA